MRKTLLRITPSWLAGNRMLLRGIAIAVLGNIGCAYHLVGSHAPFRASRIAVIPFAENFPVGVSADLATALTTRLAGMGMIITHDATSADAILSGTVVSGGAQGSPTPVGGVVGAYRLYANCHVTLTTPDGTALWVTDFAFGEDFIAATDPLRPVMSTEANQRRAAYRLAQNAAYTISQQMILEDAFAADNNANPSSSTTSPSKECTCDCSCEE